MGSPYRSFSSGYSSSGLITPGVKWLLISNTAIFVFTFLAARFVGWRFDFLKLIPADVLGGAVWQLFTYQFLHDIHQFSHIIFNMVTLFFVGPKLEHAWGTPRFVQFFLLSGAGAGIFVVLLSLLFGTLLTATIGCSGSLFGLLIAYAMLFPDDLFFGVIKAKYFVMILGGINLLGSLDFAGGGVSYVAHLGGMAVGFLILRSGLLRSLGGRGTPGADPIGWTRRQYKDWKLRRARKKFQVYMKKTSGRDPFDVQ